MVKSNQNNPMIQTRTKRLKGPVKIGDLVVFNGKLGVVGASTQITFGRGRPFETLRSSHTLAKYPLVSPLS